MKKRARIIVIIVPVLLLIVVGVFFLMRPSDSTPVETVSYATLSEIQGVVEIRQPEEDAFSEAADGVSLELGGQIRTQEDGRVRLDISSGALVRLGPQSLFTLEAVDDDPENLFARLKLELGELWVIISGGSVEVDTPSGLASVRGSYMNVLLQGPANNMTMTANCLEGACRSENDAGSVDFGAGESASSSSDATAAPSKGLMSSQAVTRFIQFNPEAQGVATELTETLAGPQSGSGDEADDTSTSTNTATNTPTYTETPTPTSTSTPTPTPTDTEIPVPTFHLTKDALCYTGPDTDGYSVVGALFAGTEVVIVGVGPAPWLVVNLNGVQCFVNGNAGDVSGDTSGLPYDSGPPKNTHTPTPTDDSTNTPTITNTSTYTTGITVWAYSGPMNINISSSGACQQHYSIEVTSPNGILDVFVEYLVEGEQPGWIPLKKSGNVYSKWATIDTSGFSPPTKVYWQFVIIDGSESAYFIPPTGAFRFTDSFGCGGGGGGAVDVSNPLAINSPPDPFALT